MEIIKCKMCGSTDLVKKDGLYECVYCKTKYTPDEAKKLIINETATIDNADELDNLWILARRSWTTGNTIDAARYYQRLVEHFPNNWEAYFYAVLCPQYQTNAGYIADIAYTIRNSLDVTVDLIKHSDLDDTDKKEAIFRILTDTGDFSRILEENISSNFENDDFIYHMNAVAALNEKCGDIWADLGDIEKTTRCYIIAKRQYDGSEKARMSDKIKTVNPNYKVKTQTVVKTRASKSNPSACYIATAIYGSYDCPQVWTLRRFRDQRLSQSLVGRAFISTYYEVSPILVRCLGDNRVFRTTGKIFLDRLVHHLNCKGFSDTNYIDQ